MPSASRRRPAAASRPGRRGWSCSSSAQARAGRPSSSTTGGARSAKLVFVTQQVDPAHPALAATVPKVRALAARVDDLVVLADGAVPEALPANCRVRTFRARAKAARGMRFEAALTAELRGLRGGAVVAHMCPIYAVLAAPLVRPLRIPLVLWFTHWRDSGLLRLAERASSAVTSVDERSFPFPSRKVRAIGHGIDLGEFPCVEARELETLRVLALGRYSPAKGLETVLHAVAQVDEASLLVHGPALTEYERAPRLELRRSSRSGCARSRRSARPSGPGSVAPCAAASPRHTPWSRGPRASWPRRDFDERPDPPHAEGGRHLRLGGPPPLAPAAAARARL